MQDLVAIFSAIDSVRYRLSEAKKDNNIETIKKLLHEMQILTNKLENCDIVRGVI